jgi:hypothetical protein
MFVIAAHAASSFRHPYRMGLGELAALPYFVKPAVFAAGIQPSAMLACGVMTHLRSLLVAIVCLTLPAACGGDDDDDDNEGAAGSSSAGSGGGSSEDPLCQLGCQMTLAADCANGPATEEECVQNCEGFASGPCAAEYDAFRACAATGEITCSPEGLPIVETCADEQGAFIACLN